MAALVGVMIMVAIGTFEWASFRIVNKMPKHDIFVGIVVALITILLHNLALAVLIGVIISALVFSFLQDKLVKQRQAKRQNVSKDLAIFFFGFLQK